MCKILTPTEYRQWIQYIDYTGDNVCKCEFKKILERKEANEKLEKLYKEIFFLQNQEKKSFFKNLKEKFSKKYCGEVKFDYDLMKFKRDFKKVSYCGKRFYNLIVKK